VLARLRRVVPKLGPEVRIILPPRLTAWQKRSLELVGLPFNQCVVYCGKRPWKVEDLVYASPVAMTGDHEPESLHWVRDIIREGLGITTAKSGWRRLYLARNRTGSRRVVNEAELLQLLLPRGFDVVDCGSLDYASQVALFSEAAFVVGPHGAAFTNVLWSPAGTQVFEIFEPGSVRRCYWSMCQALGHRHNCGIGEAVAQIHGEANIEVPILEFIQALDALDAN
jgi:capsular polysaccharide biosynthesis protein